MKSLLLRLALLLLPVSAVAINDVSIVEVGVKGYYSMRGPTPVLIRLNVPSQQGPIRLDFTVTTTNPITRIPLRVDHFSRMVSPKLGETIQLDSPVPLDGSSDAELRLDASSASGEKVGSSSVNLSSLSNVGNQALAVILCQDSRLCDEAQLQMSLGGSEDETTEKSKTFRFATLSGPRENWWDYSAVRFLVVAGSMGGWTDEQKSALEYYVRRGGTLLLLEKEADDRDFLAPYRRNPIKSGPTQVGEGVLYRIPDLPGRALNALFSGNSYKAIVSGHQLELIPGYFDGSAHGWLRREVGVSFDFPRLRWVLIWLGAYILVVGLANFTLLRKLRRLEWGWVTTTCIAVLFACALYVSSSMRRPKHVQLDDITVYRMDSRSPVAYEQINLRVSSPSRTVTTVSVGDQAVLRSGSDVPETPTAEIATEITGVRGSRTGWKMNLGPPAEIDLALLRWSFADLDLQSFHVFPGSIDIDSDLHLVNHTGQQFREGLYFDFDRNQKFLIPGLAPGQEIAVANLPSTAIWKDVEVNQFVSRQPVVDESVANQRPLPLRAIPYTAFELKAGTHFFVGASDGPAPQTNLAGSRFVRQNYVVTVVSLDQP